MSLASASGSLLADATRAARLRFWIITIGVLVIAAFASSTAYDTWHSHDYVISANNRELGNLAKALAEQAAGSQSQRSQSPSIREALQLQLAALASKFTSSGARA